jgi:putative endonuclease
MDMHCVYILYSEKLKHHYIGYSSDFDQRLIFHKNAESRKFTYNAEDWSLIYKIDCKRKGQGLAVESHIKRMKSKVYIQNLLIYPDIAIKLLETYKNC